MATNNTRSVSFANTKKGNHERPPPDFVLQDPVQPSMQTFTPEEYRKSSSMRKARAIVLDLGSSSFRAGYSTMSIPSIQIPPMVARTRDADTGSRSFLIGYDALISSARSTARPAYEAGIPNNPALMERLLDGTLVNLGLSEEDSIHHRFVLTEAPCQPNSARALLMEILFEAYLTPGVCFGIDALFSYLYNRHKYVNNHSTIGSGSQLRYRHDNALILSCGYNSTHILPLRNGKLESNGIKRINVGGYHMTDQLTRRLQLLNSEHANTLTIPRVELLKEKLCYISNDYNSELSRLKQDVEFYNQITKTVRIPLPESAEKNVLSVEEQERQRQARIDNGKRLSEMMREKRKAKAAAAAAANETNNGKDGMNGPEDNETGSYTEEEVQPLFTALKSWYELQRIKEMRELDEDKFYVALLVRKFKDPEAFSQELNDRLEKVEKERNELGEMKVKLAEESWWKKIHEDELLSMSDSELNAAELKRKRHVRALRGAAEARDRAKRAKELIKAEENRKAEELRKMREERPEEYLTKLRTEREVLAGRIKKRTAAREAGSDRRSQAARERMRLLAQHAGNKGSVDDNKNRGRTRVARTSGRSKTKTMKGSGKGGDSGNGGNGGNGGGTIGTGPGPGGGNGGGGGRKGKGGEDDDDDGFGLNDEDWDVYRSMKVGGGDSDSEDQSGEERERLEKIRAEISEMAPDDVDPTVSHPEGVALLYEDNPYADEVSVCVDRLRTGELLFQPTLAGIEQCGVAEAMGVVSNFGFAGRPRSCALDDDRASIVKEVFITGGVARTQGFKQRVCSELRQILPTEIGDEAVKGVRVANDAMLDSWRGAALFAERGEDQFVGACMSKADYEEMGPGYLKEHAFGNRFFPTPILSAADLELKKKLQKQSNKRGRTRGLVT